MKLDISIEVIDNGYIVSGEGVTNGKHYVRSLEGFFTEMISEHMRIKDKSIAQHEETGETYKLTLETDL